MKLIDSLSWKHYNYGTHKRFKCWCVVNTRSRKYVLTSTESAALKIIELAWALSNGLNKPLNHTVLERKAKLLEGIPITAHRYWNWDGKKLTYLTN